MIVAAVDNVILQLEFVSVMINLKEVIVQHQNVNQINVKNMEHVILILEIVNVMMVMKEKIVVSK